MATFGERLRYLRKAKGHSQKGLAKLLDLESSSTISQYETLNRIPDVRILQRMADLFECSLDYLLARTDVAKEKGSPVRYKELLQIMNELDPDGRLIHINTDKEEWTEEEVEEMKETMMEFIKTVRARDRRDGESVH